MKVSSEYTINVNVHVGLHTTLYGTEEHVYNLGTRETTTKTVWEGSVGVGITQHPLKKNYVTRPTARVI